MRALALALGLSLVAGCAIEHPSEPELATVAQEMSVCADGPSTVYGIDVSRFQGTIDWQKVADSGVVYAWIQISRAVNDLDAKFEFNFRRAKEVGILRGAYQRFRPGQDVQTQANIFLEKLGPYQAGDLPPMLDVEDADGLTGDVIAERVQQWIDIVEPVVGRKVIIYTGFYFWRDMVGGADFASHPLWIANYSAECPLVPATWSKWTLHQYSSKAVIPGITENTVDVNKFNGTREQLQLLVDPPVEPEPDPDPDPNPDPDPDPDPEPEPGTPELGGCSAATSGSAWLALGLVSWFGVSRRRRSTRRVPRRARA